VFELVAILLPLLIVSFWLLFVVLVITMATEDNRAQYKSHWYKMTRNQTKGARGQHNKEFSRMNPMHIPQGEKNPRGGKKNLAKLK